MLCGSSCPRQAGSLGAFGSLLGDKAAEVTALAQQRLGALGTSAADSGGGLGMGMAFGDYVLSSAANTMGSAGACAGQRRQGAGTDVQRVLPADRLHMSSPRRQGASSPALQRAWGKGDASPHAELARVLWEGAGSASSGWVPLPRERVESRSLAMCEAEQWAVMRWQVQRLRAAAGVATQATRGTRAATLRPGAPPRNILTEGQWRSAFRQGRWPKGAAPARGRPFAYGYAFG